MLPDDWKDQIGGHDVIYFGAVGWPDKIADHLSLWGSLLSGLGGSGGLAMG